MKKSYLLLTTALLFIGCSTVKLAAPTQADADRIKTDYPDITLEKLVEGKGLFEQKCSMCHALKKPQKQTAEAWGRIVPEMTQKANKKEIRINPEQQDLILKYLVAMSKPKK